MVLGLESTLGLVFGSAGWDVLHGVGEKSNGATPNAVWDKILWECNVSIV